ncbi:MAG: hypothetical protein K8F91_15675, partial [Candidatus Obscuribacterales bacterium]|nr:hypothetical protein [Candidatus Obscuribacterales bacterium]
IRTYARQSLTLFTDLGNEWGMPFPLHLLGGLAYLDQDYEEAARCYEAGLVHARKARHPLMIERSLSGLVSVAIATQDWDLARHLEEDVLELRRDSGRVPFFIGLQPRLAEISMKSGNHEQARKELSRVLLAAVDMKGIAFLYPFLIASELLRHLGIHEQAVQILSFIESHPDHKTLFLDDPKHPQTLAEQLQAALPPAVYDAAWERGKTLSANDLRTMILAHL